jgi:hypothetical protein
MSSFKTTNFLPRISVSIFTSVAGAETLIISLQFALWHI